MPSFTGYYFACNAYGDRVEEYRKRSRRNNIGSHRQHAYEKNVSKNRYMHVPSLGFANVVCHNCNGLGHRMFECRKRNLKSHGGRYNNYALQKIDSEHMKVRDLLGTKGEIPLQEQEVHRFWLLIIAT